MTKKKILSILLSAVLMLTIAMPAFAADDAGITPYIPIHCDKGGIPGGLIEKSTTRQVGSQNRNCAHGRIRKLDKRLQYQVTTTYNCTGCDLNDTNVGTPYWTDWSCI